MVLSLHLLNRNGINMVNNKKIFLRPIKEYSKKLLIGSMVIFIFVILLLLKFFQGLGFIPGPTNSLWVSTLNLIALIIAFICAVILLLEGYFRIEISISNKKIIRPGKGFGVILGLEKVKNVKWDKITSIYLLSDHIEIERENKKEIFRINVYPEEFQKIIETRFPEYKLKIKG